MPSISLVTPVYNCRERLPRCVEAVLSQTFRDFELILVDDGSTDGSGELCDCYAEQDARVRVIHKENGGAGSARNAGIEAAVGEWITFPDADDVPETDMLERLYTARLGAADGQPVDLVVCGCTHHVWDGSDEQVWEARPNGQVLETPEAIRRYFFTADHTLMFTPWNKLYRMDLIREHGLQFPQLRRGQDSLFNAAYCSHAATLAVIPYAGYHYYENTEGTYTKKFPDDIFDVFTALAQGWYNKQQEWGLSDDATISGIIGGFYLGNICLAFLSLYTADKRSRRDKQAYIAKAASHPLAARAIREGTPDDTFTRWVQSLLQKERYGTIVHLFGCKLALKRSLHPVFRFLKKRLVKR